MTTFIMEARENYDPATVTTFAGTPAGVTLADQQNIGCCFNPDERSAYYIGVVQAVNGSGQFTNSTGFTLYDGFQIAAAPAGTLTVTNNCWIKVAKKNIDTDAVVFNDVYSSANTVPANVGACEYYVQTRGSGYASLSVTLTGGGGSGMTAVGILDAGGSGSLLDVQITAWGTLYTSAPTPGISGSGGSSAAVGTARGFATPSDGTYRRIMRDVSVGPPVGANGPSLVNPRTKDFWCLAQSCELYQLRFSASYKQEISPYTYRTHSSPSSSPHVIPYGVDAHWVYCFAQDGVTNNDFLLVPSSFTTAETTADTKLAYVIYGSGHPMTDLGVRSTFGTDGNFYIFSCYATSGKQAFRLSKFVPPAVGTYGSNASGTMSDITPWTSSTGPNLTGQSFNSPTASFYQPYIPFLRLPVTNQGVGLIKFYGGDAVSSPGDAKTQFDCVYVTFGSSVTFDYHPAFVTGYMSAAWTPSTLAAAAWDVQDFRETSNYLDMSDYIYSGRDYTLRCLVFQAYPVIAGVVQSNLQTVIVQYQFVYGSAPKMVAGPFSDPNWLAFYGTYATAISNNNVVYASMMDGVTDQGSLASKNFTTVLADPGFDDPGTNCLWFSGITNTQTPTGALFNHMFHLNTAFASRAAFNTPSQTGFAAVDPPFLRLAFSGGGGLVPGGGSGGGSGGNPLLKVRKWLRSWRAHPHANVQSQRYNVLEVDMEPGVTPAGANPQIVLRYTDDAHTWSAEHYASGGPTGDYGRRIRFRRLGIERRGLSSDRVFELSGTDTQKIVIIGADTS